MTKPLQPQTPQFRTALIRRLRSMEPDYVVEFIASRGGISFRLIDRQGRRRSKPISIYVNEGHVLDRASLARQLAFAGFPGVFTS